MRKKILIWAMRLIKFFRKENELTPELMSIDENKIKLGRLYMHYGRLLYARKNEEEVEIKYFVDGKKCSQLRYQEGVQHNDNVSIEIKGKPCDKCACSIYGLPCRCDFTTGTFTGYYELIHCSRQYSDNVKL